MKEYKSKSDNYPIDQRVADLRNLVHTQKASTKEDDAYMRGMYNGLLLAHAVIAEPYGADVEFMQAPDAHRPAQ